jgi:hypothetical protein
LKTEDDGLETEAKSIAEKFESIYQEQVEEVEERQKQAEAEKIKRQQEYMETLSTTIDTFEGFTDKERKLVKDSVLKFKKLEDGTKVNDFYLKFYEIQNDPKQYVELIHYVMDREAYKQKINVKAESKATDKTWNFIKGNGSVTKKGSQITPRDTSKATKLSFSGVLNKK